MATLEQSELDIALERLTPQWLAGFFDGEGCVSASMGKNGNGVLRNPRLIVSITQSDLNLMTLIAMKFSPDGCIYQPVRKFSKREKRPVWIVSFGGKSCLAILEYIRPYVILKRKLVEWGIEMAKLTGERGKCGRGKSLPASVMARRKELMNLVKGENHSGTTFTTVM
jgi:hypothetical protein